MVNLTYFLVSASNCKIFVWVCIIDKVAPPINCKFLFFSFSKVFLRRIFSSRRAYFYLNISSFSSLLADYSELFALSSVLLLYSVYFKILSFSKQRPVDGLTFAKSNSLSQS